MLFQQLFQTCFIKWEVDPPLPTLISILSPSMIWVLIQNFLHWFWLRRLPCVIVKPNDLFMNYINDYPCNAVSRIGFLFTISQYWLSIAPTSKYYFITFSPIPRGQHCMDSSSFGWIRLDINFKIDCFWFWYSPIAEP